LRDITGKFSSRSGSSCVKQVRQTFTSAKNDNLLGGGKMYKEGTQTLLDKDYIQALTKDIYIYIYLFLMGAQKNITL
jgi:hypothetical protein